MSHHWMSSPLDESPLDDAPLDESPLDESPVDEASLNRDHSSRQSTSNNDQVEYALVKTDPVDKATVEIALAQKEPPNEAKIKILWVEADTASNKMVQETSEPLDAPSLVEFAWGIFRKFIGWFTD